jgi:hypothetical protein
MTMIRPMNHLSGVMLAKAGIHFVFRRAAEMDSRFRGNDVKQAASLAHVSR